MGRPRAANASSHMLTTMAPITPTDGQRRVNPREDFNPTAQTLSKRAATSRISHDFIGKAWRARSTDAAHEFFGARHGGEQHDGRDEDERRLLFEELHEAATAFGALAEGLRKVAGEEIA